MNNALAIPGYIGVVRNHDGRRVSGARQTREDGSGGPHGSRQKGLLIMLRTKASTYAVLAVAEIAKRQQTSPGEVQAGEIARCMDLPGAYAAKVLTQLARANILRSDRGPRGGFRLVNPPAAITLLDIIEAVDGTIMADVGLMGMQSEGRDALRRVDEVFNDIVTQVRVALGRATIADLIRAENHASSLVAAASQ